MNELWQCRVCRSIVSNDQLDGSCRICGNTTCNHCKRVCDKCLEICCMFHIEARVVMRQQLPYLHKLCMFCKEVW